MEEQKIPEGYKQTDVGVIPEDWEVKALGETLTIRHGRDQKSVQDSNGIYPILATGGQIGWSNQYLWNKPSVLIGRKGTIDKPKYFDRPFWTVDTLFYSEISSGNSAKFLYYKTCLVDWMQYNEASGVPSLNSSTIESVKVAIPAKPEQTAIANALSDVDALIAGLEKLIAKKQAIKTATMQQLLTGRTRLPEFANHPDGTPKGYKQTELGEIPEDWDVVQLGKLVAALETGVSVNSIDRIDAYSHGLHVLKTSCVSEGKFDKRQIKSIIPTDIKRARCAVRQDSIIVSRMNTPSLVGELGYVDEEQLSLFLPDRLWQIRLLEIKSTNSKWLSYLLSYRQYARKIKESATGTSGSMKNISKGAFLALLIAFPTPEEQTAIANILSDMDEELQSLQQRLDKTRQIKQGMMQELLTGKTRLV